MPSRSKLEIVKVIHDCSVAYGENLVGKSVLFVTTYSAAAIAFETTFMPRNYLHLTGVTSRLKGDLFYQAAFSNRLSTNDIGLAPDGTTDLKLDVLPQLMNIHLSARMVGDYDNSRPLLVADKFAGTVTTAMGFVLVNGIYLPNTALKVDIRDITRQATRRRVAAIFIKQRGDALYNQLTYIAKGITIDDAVLKSILSEKVDIQNLSASFSIPRKLEGTKQSLLNSSSNP